MYGGNDAFNTVLATDASSWNAYKAVRTQAPDPIALQPPGTAPNTSAKAGSPARLGGVLPIAPLNGQSRSFALHPVLGTLQTMFNSERRLAVVANVGPLEVPTTKAQYATAGHPKPKKLFSHNDQQSTWQAFAPEGASNGWGGRMCDMFAGSSGVSTFAAISTGGQAVWLSGQSARQYFVTPDGAVLLGTDPNGSIYNSKAVGDALLRVASVSRTGHMLESDYTTIVRRSMTAEKQLTSVFKTGADPRWATVVSGTYSPSSDPKLKYVNPLNNASVANPLAIQLQTVARMIDAGQALGLKRQVFIVSLNLFDTHNSQNTGQADLLAKVAHAMRYFDTTLGAMALRDKVTTFTASDFGRTFTSNGDGTDHGWGSHHFVMGGAVKGGDIYGKFPVLGAKNSGNNHFDSSPDQLLNGVLLPQISVDQYGATMGRWFGLADSELPSVFPNLSEFDAGKRNLGFMA
jgi:uncharacterized protein (DUF1501 family)